MAATADHPPAADPRATLALPVLQQARTPAKVRKLAVGVMLLIAALVPALLLVPWQQTVYGSGRAIAFNPTQRPQFLVSPIEGRVKKWYVVEGDPVKAGQLVLELVDNDPRILERLREQELLAEERMLQADGRVNDIRGRLRSITEKRPALLREQDAKIAEGKARVLQFEQEKLQALADRSRRQLEYDRKVGLYASKQGALISKDEVEEAERGHKLAVAQVDLTERKIDTAKEALTAAQAARESIDKQTQADIQTEDAALKGALSEQAAVRQQYNAIRTQVERQQAQYITAPTDGTIFRLLANAEAGGQLVQPGERLAVLVPEAHEVHPLTEAEKTAFPAAAGGLGFGGATALTPGDYPAIVAELWIDGNDLPLVKKGDRVLLQFEGWPAAQIVAFPDAAAGTFEGTVYLVDPTADEGGKFRILVEPAAKNPDGSPALKWPDQFLLRQGVRAQGWTMLNQVSLGWELWRLFNGFPPYRELEKKDGGSMFGPVGKTGKK